MWHDEKENILVGKHLRLAMCGHCMDMPSQACMESNTASGKPGLSALRRKTLGEGEEGKPKSIPIVCKEILRTNEGLRTQHFLRIWNTPCGKRYIAASREERQRQRSPTTFLG